jgi:hypothetical protein
MYEFIQMTMGLCPGNKLYEEEERKMKLWAEDCQRFRAWRSEDGKKDYTSLRKWKEDIDMKPFVF